MTHPTPFPCDSPNVVTRKAVPQVLAAPALAGVGSGRWRCLRAAGAREKDEDDVDAMPAAADVDGGRIVFFVLL